MQRIEANDKRMNKKQIIAALAGIAAMGIIYYMKFVAPVARLKVEHPEIFAATPPNAVVGGASGLIALLAVLIVTVVVILKLRVKN